MSESKKIRIGIINMNIHNIHNIFNSCIKAGFKHILFSQTISLLIQIL